MMARQIKVSNIFPSVKPHSNPKPKPKPKPKPNPIAKEKGDDGESKSQWCVYLIASSNPPFKTYVGASTHFNHRLKQHNGEIKGGAKACRAGRPWIPACIVQGFLTPNQACQFESKWKNLSRRMPRKASVGNADDEKDKRLILLLRHRYAALEKLKDVFDFGELLVDWKLAPF